MIVSTSPTAGSRGPKLLYFVDKWLSLQTPTLTFYVLSESFLALLLTLTYPISSLFVLLLYPYSSLYQGFHLGSQLFCLPYYKLETRRFDLVLSHKSILLCDSHHISLSSYNYYASMVCCQCSYAPPQVSN